MQPAPLLLALLLLALLLLALLLLALLLLLLLLLALLPPPALLLALLPPLALLVLLPPPALLVLLEVIPPPLVLNSPPGSPWLPHAATTLPSAPAVRPNCRIRDRTTELPRRARPRPLWPLSRSSTAPVGRASLPGRATCSS